MGCAIRSESRSGTGVGPGVSSLIFFMGLSDRDLSAPCQDLPNGWSRHAHALSSSHGPARPRRRAEPRLPPQGGGAHPRPIRFDLGRAGTSQVLGCKRRKSRHLRARVDRDPRSADRRSGRAPHRSLRTRSRSSPGNAVRRRPRSPRALAAVARSPRPLGIAMNFAQLEHIIRAAATIADDDEIVIVGSQSVLGQFPDAPAELLRSMEADVYPYRHPERWDLIDGSLGEGSPFHLTFGYYAQGVGPETAVLPAGGEERSIRIRTANTRGATGTALEIHDLLVAKHDAGRDKAREFA